jgi:hypothetical protein
MVRKLTILIDDAVYEGLHRVVGGGGISRFLEDLAQPHVAQRDLSAQYREAVKDAAREAEAQAWSEGLVMKNGVCPQFFTFAA